MYRRILLPAGLGVLAVFLIAGCGAGHEVGDVRRRLVERYVDPLAEEGITTAVQRACRYRAPLVYNNAVPEDRFSAVSWEQECP